MTQFVVIFLTLVALTVGSYAGWAIRGRLEAGSPGDPEAELRALREAHSGCATRIRNLHLELAQLETKLSMSRVEASPRQFLPAATNRELTGAARLASLIDVLESAAERDDTAEPEHPAAFMSILPADLVESRTVRQPISEPSPATDEPAIMVSLLPVSDHEADVGIEIRHPDDLTLIKGIGPKIESILHEQGITTFRQIAELDRQQVEALGAALGSFRGRIVRDDWVGAARRMLSEPATR